MKIRVWKKRYPLRQKQVFITSIGWSKGAGQQPEYSITAANSTDYRQASDHIELKLSVGEAQDVINRLTEYMKEHQKHTNV